ncbi:MAG: lipid-transfer protein [Dehalococcoidia bacterium]
MRDDYRPFRDRCAIAGIGRTEFSKDSGRSELTLACEAAHAAVRDAGLTLADIDGLVRCDMDHVSPAAIVGAMRFDNIGFLAEVGVGGTAPCGMIGVAVAAVVSGQASAVLVYRALNGRSESRFGAAIAPRTRAGGQGNYDEFFTPYGLLTAPQSFALLAQRHIIEYGTKPEHFAAVALTARAHANRTPHAQMYGKPLTLDDYLAARMISTPLRLFDCCLETDGACAVVVTSAARARDLPNPPVLIRAVSQAAADGGSGGMMFPSITYRNPLRLAPGNVARRLWDRAGLGPKDMDVAQFYDCFTITVLLQFEDYGFCGRGESGPFAASGAIADCGSIPINTDGGNMSGGYIHGLNHVVEGTRQMRGTADVQIAGAETCLVTSGPTGFSGALVLRRGT